MSADQKGMLVIGLFLFAEVAGVALMVFFSRRSPAEPAAMPSLDMPVGESWPPEGNLPDDGPIDLWPAYVYRVVPDDNGEH